MEAPERMACTCQSALRFIGSHFTVLRWAKNIQLRRDLVAGLTVGVMAVPQAMSYAPPSPDFRPKYGLYNAFVGLLPYCLLALRLTLSLDPRLLCLYLLLVSSLHLEVPDASVSDKFRHVTLSCSSDPSSEGCNLRIAIALTLSLLAGFIQIGFGLLRFGFIVDLVSEPIIVGFTTGSAFLIALNSIYKHLGHKQANKR